MKEKSLNSRINAKLQKKRRNPAQKLTENQELAAVCIFLEGGQNSTSRIAERLGVSYGAVSSAINKYLKSRKELEYIIIESKINKD